MRSLILLSLALLLPVLAIADPQPWMKKENPNELYLMFLYEHECSIARESLEQPLTDVLARSRIRRLQSVGIEIFILVSFACSEYEDNVIYSFDIDFASVPSSYSSVVRYGSSSIGSFGVQPRDSAIRNLKERFEELIADYLRANFDLGDDE